MCEKVQLKPRRLARRREKWTCCATSNRHQLANHIYDQANKYDHSSRLKTTSRQIISRQVLGNNDNTSSELRVVFVRSHRNKSPRRLSESSWSTPVMQITKTLSEYLTIDETCSTKSNSGSKTNKNKLDRTRSGRVNGAETNNLMGTRLKRSCSARTRRRKKEEVGRRKGIDKMRLLASLFGIAALGVVFLNTTPVGGSLIIGDSAIEIQEVDSEPRQRPPDGLNNQLLDIANSNLNDGGNNLVLGKANGNVDAGQQSNSILSQADSLLTSSNKDNQNQNNQNNNRISGPLPPILSPETGGGDSSGPDSSDSSSTEASPTGDQGRLGSGGSGDEDRAISGRVVDFELTPAGGHNKAKIKKKKKKEKKMAEKEEKKFKKWSKKKKSEKKAKEMKHMEEMKKKKQEGKKGKKKWGKEVHGQKKKGSFKKKKWGEKVKKGKGIKKGKKGKKMLADKGHKNTGFKSVYHKEEWGDSKKWHDIKREKKWDEQSKKWKKKWKKEKGKKYKGDHMKKYEKQKKHGKKYKKEKKEKFKKEKKEEFKKGMKKKKEEHMKKKEGGKKKEMKEEKKKKEMKKKKKKKGRK